MRGKSSRSARRGRAVQVEVSQPAGGSPERARQLRPRMRTAVGHRTDPRADQVVQAEDEQRGVGEHDGELRYHASFALEVGGVGHGGQSGRHRDPRSAYCWASQATPAASTAAVTSGVGSGPASQSGSAPNSDNAFRACTDIPASANIWTHARSTEGSFGSSTTTLRTRAVPRHRSRERTSRRGPRPRGNRCSTRWRPRSLANDTAPPDMRAERSTARRLTEIWFDPSQ